MLDLERGCLSNKGLGKDDEMRCLGEAIHYDKESSFPSGLLVLKAVSILVKMVAPYRC